MSDQRSFFCTFKPVLSDSWTVSGIGSTRLFVREYGNIEIVVSVGTIKRIVTIESVLYVPNLGTNLISIAAVTAVGLSVHFIETKVTFKKNKAVVMIGERIGKTLYHLSILPKLSEMQQQTDTAFLSVPPPTPIDVWHQRLAHVSYKTILKMSSKQLVEGLQLPANTSTPKQPCLGCVSGKMQRSPFPIGRERANKVGQLIHSDVCGPMHVSTPGRAKFFALFTDDYSGWRAVYFLKQKSEVAESFKNFVNTLRSETGHTVHTLRADNGGEFVNQSLKTWLSDRAIRIETSAPYSPEQNGVSERANRTIMEGARSLIYAKHLPLELWGEAIACTVYSLNRVCNSTSPLTPYENWYGKKPDISHFRIFGSTAFIHVPKAERRKLESKSFKCYFVGYSLTQKAYRFWDPVGRKIKISRDVIFDENCNVFSNFSPQIDNLCELYPKPTNPATTPQQQIINTVDVMPLVAGEMDIQPESSPECSEQPETTSFHPEDNPAMTEDLPPDNPATTHGKDLLPSSTPSIRHSPYPLRVRVPTRQWSSLLSTDVQTREVYEPTSYSDAMECADAHLWKIAIQEEYDSLISNKTWHLSSLPTNRTSIKFRWIFKVKPGTQDSPP